MMPTTAFTAALFCHPATPTDAISGIEVEIAISGDSLTLNYVLQADLDRLRIPPPKAPRQGDDLWRHTCFEAFVGVKGGSAYREFNFSPSGEWASYSFSAYREPTHTAAASDPGIKTRREADRLHVGALMRVGDLPMGEVQLLALSAVIEEASGLLSCWALRHPSGKPDFHHPEAFALELELDAAPET